MVNADVIYESTSGLLQYDERKSILTFRPSLEGPVIWLKKINEARFIDGVIEDAERFYIACGISETEGRYIAIFKESGSTAWYIPGRSYMQRLFGESLYLIFVDENDTYYIIKTRPEDGSIVWHHRVDEHLCAYTIKKNAVVLAYSDGRSETLDPSTGMSVGR